jgi:hypothetical protein
MHFYRVPPPSGVNQATVFQQTGATFGAGVGIRASFSLGNSSSVRKRLSVVLTDADFSDLSVCTFWLPPNSPMQTYALQTHTTEVWSNASIYFYAATAGSDGGYYLLDHVVLEQDSTIPTTRTDCLDPTAPPPAILPIGPNLIANGTFDSNSIPPWIAFGSLVYQVPAGVVEMVQPPGAPGAFLQPTGAPIAANQTLTAGFSLGNSSAVRKRVTVLLHDLNFSDLSACTFWLPPGAPLANYVMVTYTTQAWANATLSFYVATQGNQPWVRLDNAYMFQTPSTLNFGTQCLEPGSAPASLETSSARAKRSPVGSAAGPAGSGVATAAPARGAGRPAPALVSEFVADLDVDQRSDVIHTLDLRSTSSASLTFESALSAGTSNAEVQVSEDGSSWQTIMQVPASEEWMPLSIDLSAWSGRVIQVRFAFQGAATRFGRPPDMWRIGDVRVSK